ncbi:MAG TPA: DUF3536 domain-containing protein [Candidatus Omnitrophota bacterium]|nr:DUF3536 domain-containing protein [Candidatus Omnitrophota bacterium]HQO58521.1 DUF3536 domain-containing protein [Candidatus Omnitrophota bacterium]
MNRYVCIHGHFYQPPRENPWLEEVEMQESAYPFHDWNQRITAECYATNTASRILDQDKKIIDIVNNYARISFNFGPTLLSWMQRKDPETHAAIVQADVESRSRFSGHGSALAQCYNHMIMPLANARDKLTQVLWGIRDFEYRFGREPEGMWLPETAVNLETLDLLVQHGITFTILSPRQAKCVKVKGDKKWTDVSDSKINPRKPYLCRLPSGKTIVLFFYDGPISHDIAFERLLESGETLAKRLVGAFSPNDEVQLVHIATDGETYGHHHNLGDMALAYGINYIRANDLAEFTNYGEFLEKHPAEDEVEIYENSSWSCIHGVERWRTNCGCHSGMHGGWTQAWRQPLREALDWLRDQLILLYETETQGLIGDPWQARNDYIHVVLDRSLESVEAFLGRHALKELTRQEKIKLLKLMEIQRHAMLMYTSCGWFFDEVSGIETVQIMQYAARAIQMAKDISPSDLEQPFLNRLKKAPSNIAKFKNGANVYEQLVRPRVLDLVRVAAHYAVSSLFEEYSQTTTIHSYTAIDQLYDRLEVGKFKLAVGKALLRSDITWEEQVITFAVLHLGDHNIIGGVRVFSDEKIFVKMQHDIKESFRRGDITGTINLIEQNFDGGNYSLWHLFKDEQTEILYQILHTTLEEIEVSLRQINEHHYPIIQVIKQLHIPLPKVLANTVLVMLNTDLLHVIGDDEPDFKKLEQLVSEVLEWSFEIDRVALEFMLRKKINGLMEEFNQNPSEINPLLMAEAFLRVCSPLHLNLDLWRAQNIYFSIGKDRYCHMKNRAELGDENAKRWVEYFDKLGHYLKVRVPQS